MKKLLAGFFQMPELVNYYLCSELEEQGMITDSEGNAILSLEDTLSAEEILSDVEDETQSAFEDETLAATELSAAEDETLMAVEDDASNTEELATEPNKSAIKGKFIIFAAIQHACYI